MARRFLITGGSQGIGAALVTLARKAGHDVMFTGRNVGLIDKIARETGAHGIEADVSVGADNAKTVEACHARMGGIDVLDQQRSLRLPGRDRLARRRRHEEAVRHERVRHGRHHQPCRAGDDARKARRHRQHRVDLRHEGRQGRHAVRGQQVGRSWHHAVLADRAPAAGHPRRVRLPIGSADQLGRQDRDGTTRTSSTPRTSARPSWRRSTCRAACCGPSSPCLRTTPGKRTSCRGHGGYGGNGSQHGGTKTRRSQRRCPRLWTTVASETRKPPATASGRLCRPIARLMRSGWKHLATIPGVFHPLRIGRASAKAGLAAADGVSVSSCLRVDPFPPSTPCPLHGTLRTPVRILQCGHFPLLVPAVRGVLAAGAAGDRRLSDRLAAPPPLASPGNCGRRRAGAGARSGDAAGARTQRSGPLAGSIWRREALECGLRGRDTSRRA